MRYAKEKLCAQLQRNGGAERSNGNELMRKAMVATETSGQEMKRRGEERIRRAKALSSNGTSSKGIALIGRAMAKD